MLRDIFAGIGFASLVILIAIMLIKVMCATIKDRREELYRVNNAILAASFQPLDGATITLDNVGISYDYESSHAKGFKVPKSFWQHSYPTDKARALVTLVTFAEKHGRDISLCSADLAVFLAKRARKNPGIVLAIVSAIVTIRNDLGAQLTCQFS